MHTVTNADLPCDARIYSCYKGLVPGVHTAIAKTDWEARWHDQRAGTTLHDLHLVKITCSKMHHSNERVARLWCKITGCKSLLPSSTAMGKHSSVALWLVSALPVLTVCLPMLEQLPPHTTSRFHQAHGRSGSGGSPCILAKRLCSPATPSAWRMHYRVPLRVWLMTKLMMCFLCCLKTKHAPLASNATTQQSALMHVQPALPTLLLSKSGSMARSTWGAPTRHAGTACPPSSVNLC